MTVSFYIFTQTLKHSVTFFCIEARGSFFTQALLPRPHTLVPGPFPYGSPRTNAARTLLNASGFSLIT
jgi:hypothetical protein